MRPGHHVRENDVINNRSQSAIIVWVHNQLVIVIGISELLAATEAVVALYQLGDTRGHGHQAYCKCSEVSITI